MRGGGRMKYHVTGDCGRSIPSSRHAAEVWVCTDTSDFCKESFTKGLRDSRVTNSALILYMVHTLYNNS